MRLTQDQVTALASELSKSKRIAIENAVQRKKLYDDKKNIALSKKYASILNQIPESVRRALYMSKEEKEFLNAIVSVQFKPKKEVDDFEQVRKLLIIESIEAKNLDDLIKRVKAKI